MTVSTSFGKGLIREKDIERLAVATTDYFNERVDYKVEVKVLLGEKDANGNLPTVMINRSDVGSCVDPSTERYWSM